MKQLDVLILEDNPNDAALVERELRRHGYELRLRVEQTADGLRRVLQDPSLELIISDYRMPKLTAPDALRILQDSGCDVPFIVVSGSIGESSAVDILKHGAADFVLKDNLARLVPAIERELREVVMRREKTTADEALREAVRARDEFLSLASHELRTPLTTLQLQLGAISKYVDQSGTDDRLRRRVTLAKQGADRLVKLIDRVLDTNRMLSTGLTLERRPGVDLGALTARIMTELQPAFEEAGCNVQLSLADNVTGTWDAEAIEVAIANVISNAIKYGAHKPIHVSVEAHDAVARVVVVDHGIGIPPEFQSRIFERFARAVSSWEFGGFGVGLWQASKVIELHGGTIHVQSAPGQGATFVIELPRSGG
jgi:signal transduction histidine kinase